MNRQFLQRVFGLHYSYSDPLDQQRAQALVIVIWFAILGVSSLVFNFFLGDMIRGESLETIEIVELIQLAITFSALMLVQSGRLNVAGYLVVGAIYLTVTVAFANYSIAAPEFVVTTLPIIAAGLTLNPRGYSFFTGLTLGTMLILGTIEFGSLQALLAESSLFVAYMVLFLTGVSLYFWGNTINKALRVSVAEVAQFRRVVEFVRREDLTEETFVMARMVDFLRNQLNYSFAQIFLADERGMLSRRFRTGLNMPEGGVLTEVSVGDASALNEAYRLEQAVAVAKSDNPVRLAHFLPASNYGVALPILVGGRVAGVLDVQKEESPFADIEMVSLTALVGELGTMMTYVRRISDLRNTVDSLQSNTEILRAQLREYKQTEREQVSETWANYLSGRNRFALGYDMDSAGTVSARDLPDTVLTAMVEGEIVVREGSDGRQTVFVPVVLRGEVIGALTFQIPAGATVAERQLNFAQSVTTRLALALENKRLFEASQAQANRERKANEVAGVLISATEVDDVLLLAAQQFNEAIGAVGTRVRLDVDLLAEGSLGEETRPSKPNRINGGKA